MLVALGYSYLLVTLLRNRELNGKGVSIVEILYRSTYYKAVGLTTKLREAGNYWAEQQAMPIARCPKMFRKTPQVQMLMIFISVEEPNREVGCGIGH